jgi:hypothetical protein
VQPENSNRNQKIIASVAILAAMTLIVFGVSAFSGDSGSNASVATTAETESTLSEQTDTTPAATDTTPATTQEATTTPTPQPATPSPSPAVKTKYKNGTYSATGSYSTPENTESISISVTIENDVITAASAQNTAKDRESKEYQADFISGYKAKVIGKALASLNLGNVSGSSLTPIGFNNAIAKIRTQAQS